MSGKIWYKFVLTVIGFLIKIHLSHNPYPITLNGFISTYFFLHFRHESNLN